MSKVPIYFLSIATISTVSKAQERSLIDPTKIVDAANSFPKHGFRGSILLKSGNLYEMKYVKFVKVSLICQGGEVDSSYSDAHGEFEFSWDKIKSCKDGKIEVKSNKYIGSVQLNLNYGSSNQVQVEEVPAQAKADTLPGDK